jgi:hypothetical protein
MSDVDRILLSPRVMRMNAVWFCPERDQHLLRRTKNGKKSIRMGLPSNVMAPAEISVTDVGPGDNRDGRGGGDLRGGSLARHRLDALAQLGWIGRDLGPADGLG